jgi:predicted ATPase
LKLTSDFSSFPFNLPAAYCTTANEMIRRFRARNFKSLADVSVDLEPVTVLIGKSGAGKSNFVNAIRFLRDIVSHYSNALNVPGGMGKILCATAKTGDTTTIPLTFDVAFRISGFEEDFNYTLGLDFQSRSHLTGFAESLSIGERTVFRHAGGKWVVEPKVIGVPQPQGVMLDRLNGIEEVGIAHQMLVKGIGCYDFSGDVLQSSNGQARVPQSGLADDAGNYLSAFETIAGDLQNLHLRREILAAVRELNKTVRSIEIEKPNRSNIIIAHQVADRVLPLSLVDESEGLRRFLAHLIALYQIPPKQCLVFEEPEKGIYPAALSVLSDFFKAAPNKGRGQVILTTHSPQLLEAFDPQSFRVVERDHRFETHIGPVAHEQLEALRENLLTGGELLTVDSPRIQGAPENLLHSQ